MPVYIRTLRDALYSAEAKGILRKGLYAVAADQAVSTQEIGLDRTGILKDPLIGHSKAAYG